MKYGKRVLAVALAGVLFLCAGQAGATDVDAKSKIKLSKTKLSITVGKKATIKLKNVSKKDVRKIKWTTSNKKTVKVSPTKKSVKTTVKAVAVGKATVKAKLGKKSYSCKVTVTPKKVEQKLAMIRDTYATYVGTAVGVRPYAVGDKPVDMGRLSYKSSDTSVAKIVGKQGAVEGVKAGTATITITTDMGAKMSATVKVFASKNDADEANDFYQKQVNDRLADLAKEGIIVTDGMEPIGINKQGEDKIKMVKEFSDTYLNNVKKGNKYADNTPADVIASIRSVFDLEESQKKEQLMKDIKEYLEPLEKAETFEEFLDYNKKVVKDGEYGLWRTKCGQLAMNMRDPESGIELKSGQTILKPELVPGTIMERKSDFKDSEKVKRLKTLIKETLLLTGESEADAEKNKETLVKVFETITPEITMLEVASKIEKLPLEEKAKFLEEHGLVPPAGLVADDKMSIDMALPGFEMGKTYSELGVDDKVLIMSDQLTNCWTTLMDYLKNGNAYEIRELMKFCVAYKYVGYTESGYYALRLFEVKKNQLTVDPSKEELKKDFAEKVITSLCDNAGFEICGEYTEKYLGGSKLKADLTNIIELYKNEFKGTFNDCPWMSEQGKTGAVKKMDKMEFVIGDAGNCNLFRLHEDLQTAGEGGSIFSNFHKISQNSLNNYVAILGKQLKGQDNYFFTMESAGHTPMDMNASYAATSNVFCIFAGIIGDETYKQGNEVFNLGRIGYVIGHEIGHAFDANGANFDENGEYVQWMTDEDVRYFNEIQQKCIKLFDQYSAFYDKTTGTIYYANGEKELSENMADFSSAEVTARIAKNNFDQDKKRELFRQLSLFWATMNFDPGKIISDEHGPGPLRGIVPFQMQDEFYEIFGIKEGDAMYIAPENRVRIWS